MKKIEIAVFSLLVVFGMSVLGCSKSGGDHPETIPVKCKVIYKSEPVEGAIVSFINNDAQGQSASAMTDSEGVAVMKTWEDSAGVLPGSYKVTVRKSEVISTPNPKDPGGAPLKSEEKWLTPQKYSRVSSSGLTADISKDSEPELTFELTD